jgi:L-alanine-DL-glutamate epimerase-like enolase superfamily enzyme
MPDDFEGCAEVRRDLAVPIVAGENEYTRWGARDLIEARAADILNLDVVIAGGITEYRKIAALASAFHIPVAPHGTVHMSMHSMASVDNGLIMEVYPSARRYFNPTLPPIEIVNGFTTVPETPGLGLEFDADLVRKYRVS